MAAGGRGLLEILDGFGCRVGDERTFAFSIVGSEGDEIVPGAMWTLDSRAVQYGAGWCGAVRCGAVRWGEVRCGEVRYGAVRCGAVWYGCGAEGFCWRWTGVADRNHVVISDTGA